jgi:Tol biopolymer transport system component
MSYRTLNDGQKSQVWLGGPHLADPVLVLETDAMLVEAPNWSQDGTSLLINANGLLWSLDVTADDPQPVAIDFDGLPEINNDHVLDPDGEHVFMSAMDGHVYRGAISGGAVECVTPDDGKWHFLHGVSPDGTRLAYVELGGFEEPGRLAVMPLGGEAEIIDTGEGHIDGPEFSPDGGWVYLNTEAFTETPGHAQLARIGDSGDLERLVSSDTVDWFPHLSPDAALAAYIAFPLGTLGHPADLDVEVRLVATSDWSRIIGRYPLFGGQGTINVNSWAPDSARFAFVAYPQS